MSSSRGPKKKDDAKQKNKQSPAKKTLKKPVKKIPVVPKVIPMSGGTVHNMLFTAHDAAALAQEAGVIPRQSADYEAIAAAMHKAFDFALSAYGISKNTAAPAEKRDWFNSLQTDALSLLRTLGHDSSDLALAWGASLSITARQNILDEFFQYKFLHKYSHLPREFEPFINHDELEKQLKSLRTNSDLPASREDELKVLWRVSFVPLLKAIPQLIALFGELGRSGAERHGTTTGNKTKSTDLFQPTLFCHLVGAYELLTGKLPKVRSGERRDPGLPPVIWMRAILAQANQDVGSVFQLDNTDATSPIKSLNKLEPQTIADRIERGCKDWRKRKAKVSTELA